MFAVAAGLLALSVAFGAEGAESAAIRSETLDNGMQVILAPDARAASVDLSVWYKAGTVTESSGQSGSTNLLGRLMYLGSKQFDAVEHARQIAIAGGTLNSTVNPDYAGFFQTLPPEALETAIRMEADRMKALTFDEGDVQSIVAALHAQRQQVEHGSSVGLGLEKLYGLAFEGHPYAWPVVGRDSDLDRLTVRSLEQYHREHFAPEMAVVTIVGRCDADAALAAVRKHFGALPRRTRGVQKVPAVEAHDGLRRVTEGGASSRMIMVGWLGPGAGSADMPAFELLTEILVGGSGSRLMRSSVAPGVAARGDLDRRRLASLLYCVAAPRPGTDTTGVEQAVIERMEAVATEELSVQEIERAKKRMEAALTFAMQSPRGRAEQIGAAQMLVGDYHLASQRIDKLRAVSAEDLRRTAQKYLTADHRNVVWLMTDEGGAGR